MKTWWRLLPTLRRLPHEHAASAEEKTTDASVLLLHEDLIDIAPTPRFSRLERLDDRVSGLLKMFGGVLVLGGIAAADMATLQADAQMNPGVAAFQAFLATIRGRLHIADLTYVRAGGRHRGFFGRSCWRIRKA